MLNKPTAGRIGEIDALRGMAIILMVIFHTVVDLRDFYHYQVDYHTGFWYYLGKLSASLFIFVSGLSATLATATFSRSIRILACGLVLTVITWFYSPDWYIRFGILHFLGISLLTYPLLNKQTPGPLLGLAFIAAMLGYWATRQIVPWSFLIPFGLLPADFQTIDYYPLFPWYGVFLLGAAAGKQLYKTGTSLLPGIAFPKSLTFLSRHSLIVYLVHQPLLLLWLYILHQLK